MKKRGRMKRGRRAQAQIITVILIILIVIVGILIVWNVFRPLIARAAERISLSKLKVDLEIESAYIDDDNQTAYVAVKRGVGKANLTALKFIFTDVNGKNYIYKYPISDEIPNELESKVYNITALGVNAQNPDLGGGFTFENIVSVGIAFVVRSSYGSEVIGDIKDTFGDSKKEDIRRDSGLRDSQNMAEVFEEEFVGGGACDLINSCEDYADEGNCDNDGCGFGICSWNGTVCLSIMPCQLTNAYWLPSGLVDNGTLVQLIVEGTNCVGESIDFEIYEDDPLFNDLIILKTANYDNTTWTALWTYVADQYSPGYPENDDDDIGSDPRDYFFTATLVSDPGVSVDSKGLGNPLLNVNQSSGVDPCAGINDCSYYDSIGETECNADTCVSGGCLWNSSLGICEEFVLTFPQDYVSYWKFDEQIDMGTYNMTPDETGINNGTLVDNAVTVYDSARDYSGTNGYVLSLDGNGDYVDAGNEPEFTFTNTDDFTVGIWIYANSIPEYVITKGRVGVSGWVLFYNIGNDRLELRIDDGTGYVYARASDVSPANKWVYLTVTWNSSSHKASIYVDGDYKHSDDSPVLGDFTSSYTLQIGTYRSGSLGYFNGLIDDVIIYNRTLSEAEISQIYNAQRLPCIGITKCPDYTDSNNCEENICGVGGSCTWDGNNCSTAQDTWYVRPSGGSYGTENGASYDDAWDGLNNILWGVNGVNAGDTLYICGLHLVNAGSGSEIDIGASGVEGDPIIIRGDYPGDAGEVWGGSKLSGSWTDEGSDAYSILLPHDTYRDFFWENVTQSSHTLLEPVSSIQEVRDNAGTFYSSDYQAGSNLYVHTSDNGDPANRIVVNDGGYSFEMPSISYIIFKNFEYYWPSFDGSLDYITWDGLTMWYGTGMMLRVRDAWDDLTFKNCDIAWAPNGIYTTAVGSGSLAADNLTVSNCTIHDIGNRPSTYSGDAHAIGIQMGNGHVFEYNELYNCGNCLLMYVYTGGDCKDGIVRYNYVHDCHTSGGLTSGYGIATQADSDSLDDKSGWKIHNNVVSNCVAGIRLNWEDTQYVWNNVMFNNTYGFVSTRNSPITGANVQLRNNIFYENTYHVHMVGNDERWLDFDYNLYYPNDGTRFYWEGDTQDFSQWQSNSKPGCVFDPNSIVADPMFVSADPQVPADFKLQSISSAIDNGTDVGLTQDYEGNPIMPPPDIGAYEYVP